MLNNIKAIWQVIHDIKLSESKKEELIKKRLKRVLVSAYYHVPYYRNMMKNIGYNPDVDYKGPEDLKRFPVTKKQDLKTNDQSMFLKEGIQVKNLYSILTSGSTGIPLKIFLSNHELAFRRAKWLRVLFANQYSIKNKVSALVVPLKVEEEKTFFQKFGILKRLAINLLLPPDKLAENFLSYKPNVLYGNRSTIDLLAMELIRRKITPEGLKLILVGGEIIYEHTINLYKRAFGIYPTEFYGSEEMGTMAYETPARDMLPLCDDLTYFEFLDKNNNPVSPGEQGRVIATDLIGLTMPFIRYDQGDLATVKIITGCDGKSEKRISEIIGRDDDYVVLPDGTIRSSYHFCNGIAQKFNEIYQFKVIQKTITRHQVKIAANQEYFEKIVGQFRDFLYTKFPKNCCFEISRVDYIEPDSNGKIRSFISEIKND